MTTLCVCRYCYPSMTCVTVIKVGVCQQTTPTTRVVNELEYAHLGLLEPAMWRLLPGNYGCSIELDRDDLYVLDEEG